MKNKFAMTRKGRFAEDACGHRVALKWARYERFGRFFPRELVRGIRRSIARRPQRFGLNARQMAFIAFVGGVGYFFAIVFGWILVGLPVGLVWVYITVVLHTMKDPHPLIVEELLARRLCAACGYDLSRTVKDDQGRSVCSECGAAWRLSPDAVYEDENPLDHHVDKVQP